MSGGYFVLGTCWSCKRGFTFNPHLVPSIPIDPTTELPPDVGGTDPALAVREPLCPDCVETVNERRRTEGREPIRVLDGAYELVEGLP